MSKKVKQPSNHKNILLFPGEAFEFNQSLIHYDAFGFNNGNLISKRCGVLKIDPSTNKPLEGNEEEIYKSVGKYYSPKVDDFIIGIITQKSSEFYRVDIGTYTYAVLNAIDFSGATRKSKPNLNLGDIVYAKVSKLNKHDTPTISCTSDIHTKDWASGEAYFGELKEGNIFSFPRQYAWDIMNGYAYQRIGDYISLEICIGFNGRMWMKSEKSIEIHNILVKSLEMSNEEVEKMIHEEFNKMNIS
jgi:exosome complex component RRP40